MSLKSSIENYKQAEYLYKTIDEVYTNFEEGKISEIRQDTVRDKVLDDINKLYNVIDKVNLRDFEGQYSSDVIEDVKHNIDFIYEAISFIEKYLLSGKYYDSVLHSAIKYINKMKLDDEAFKKYKNKEELAKKFTGTLLHSDNIEKYINQIKRIALGTMSKQEFEKIFKTLEDKIIPSLKTSTPEKKKPIDIDNSNTPETEEEYAKRMKEREFQSFNDYSIKK